MRRVAVIVLACAACDGSAVDGALAPEPEPQEPAAPPTPWVFDDAAHGASPTLTPAELAHAITLAIDAARAFDPGVVHALYDAIAPHAKLAAGDPSGCPYVIDYGYGLLYWQGECEASDGTRYLGYGVVVDDEGDRSFYRFLVGTVTAPDGTWLEGAGEASDQDYDGRTIVLDAFRAGGPGAGTSPWLDGSRAARFALESAYAPERGAALAVFEVSLRAPDMLPRGIDAVVLEDLTIMNRAAGAYCDLEPGGGAAVRTSDGEWYEVAFDGRTRDAEELELALCDGCGATSFRGAPLSPTCLDPTPWFAAP